MAAATGTKGTITLSRKARERLNAPSRRGKFRDLDAARAQLGLLSVADSDGQARIYWLIDLNTQVIEDARFLAFGSLASHAIADVFSDRVRGMSVEAACALTPAELEAELRDDPATPAFAEAELAPLAFITELQELAQAALPAVKLLPKPKEVERYQRKREQDWDEQDRAWLPLSLMKKIMQVQQIAGAALAQRLGRNDIAWSVEGLHDDFRVVVSFNKGDGAGLPVEEQPTVAQFIQETLRGQVHPAIVVEVQ